ncbi:LuxR C-terminal-related transcriptional regulator [Flavobacterium sp. AS60]|uniref:LuxR C-terminal-related transcriptional regulator n=1 Tax=Flavobacterium anseongense TaxID=2910677 RepID=UPI001F323989|nr:LuxR C-terminal-related transcriptional regulator [Flavobacterium sp. AS60]MCF6128649.1 LuxR C-terminal-related transcriptional regulator [Flavobacterium sp. AS60]
MPLQMMEEAQKIWDNIKMEGSVESLNFEIELQRKLLNFFHVGNYYYYIFDVMNGCFKYISPQMKEVLGYCSEDMTIEYFFSRIHPDDQPILLNYEKEVVDFFQKLTADKITKYKFSYDYRIQNSENKYVRLLQQVITIQFDNPKKILLTLGVHTDISHIKKDNTTSLSFIGLDGEPSFIDVDVAKIYKGQKSLLTSREKEIINMLIKGDQTIDIAQKLFISPHTVNTHRKNILRKTEAKSTTELAAIVIQKGLL